MAVIIHVSAVYIAISAKTMSYNQKHFNGISSIYIAPPEVIDGYCKNIIIAFIIFLFLFIFQSYSFFSVSVFTQGTVFIVKVEIIVVINRRSH